MIYSTSSWLITGASGFIGSRLAKSLTIDKQKVWGLSRKPLNILLQQNADINWINSLEDIRGKTIDYVVNLAGESIAAKRWTQNRKNKIWTSRVDFTKFLSCALKTLSSPPSVIITGSAISYYGTGYDIKTEADLVGCGFSARLCQSWEAALDAPNSRNILLRIGTVLGSEGGILYMFKPIYLLGLGGRIGSGKQMMSWIHIDDLINLIRWIIHYSNISGSVNATAPNPISQYNFAQQYARALNRPTLITIPTFFMRLLFGQMAEEILLSGQIVLPHKAIQSGFKFTYPRLSNALETLL